MKKYLTRNSMKGKKNIGGTSPESVKRAIIGAEKNTYEIN